VSDDEGQPDSAYYALGGGLILALVTVSLTVGALCYRGILQLVDAIQQMGG
jgi:hypothetical protein